MRGVRLIVGVVGAMLALAVAQMGVVSVWAGQAGAPLLQQTATAQATEEVTTTAEATVQPTGQATTQATVQPTGQATTQATVQPTGQAGQPSQLPATGGEASPLFWLIISGLLLTVGGLLARYRAR